MIKRFILFLVLFLLTSCQTVKYEVKKYELKTPADNKIAGIYDLTTIDYNQSEKYLTPGKQSGISDVNFEKIQKSIGKIEKQDMPGIARVFRWYTRYFKSAAGGGRSIGQITADEIIDKKEIDGCHSASLILSSVLRKYGYPAVMIDTASIKWAKDYKNSPGGMFIGHVLSEIYVNGRWILLDTNGKYIDNYDPYNPYIPSDNPVTSPSPLGLFVMRKGIDTWGYGVTYSDKIRDLMIEFAGKLDTIKPYLNNPGYIWKSL